jgi:very-short-patch-repair endonuclease
MRTASDAVAMLRASVRRERERRLCESPIELQFYDAMRRCRSLDAFTPQVVVADGKYRIDFGDPTRKIGVELDGYEFHSSKDQFTKDRERQRELEMLGWRLIRFSGREVHNDSQDCVRQLIKWLETVS